MKKFAVTIISDAVVESDTKDEAIQKAKAMLKSGIDTCDDADFFASEITDVPYAEEIKTKSAPELRPFTVLLEATSTKEVELMAVDADAAMELAHEMYFNTGALDFTDEDVDCIHATVIDEEEDMEDTLKDLDARKTAVLTELVRDIREVDIPAEELAVMLKDGLDRLVEAIAG